uniref:Cathepsin propeptide inhibitor domain-containing protein n=1 Tax=Xiphophorus maculatus TaxID=8083 RepID=A0A3B5QNW6_XIPMA
MLFLLFFPTGSRAMLPLLVLMLWVNTVLSAMTTDPTLDQHWELWKNLFLFLQTEEGWRRMVWEKNLKKIELHNLEQSMGKHSFTLGMNHFGDLTNEEFRQMMNGYKPRAEKKVNGSLFMKPNFLNVPSSVDWRESGYVTPVNNNKESSALLLQTEGSVIYLFKPISRRN